MINCTTYAHLGQYVQGFADDCLGLLFIVGPPGTGKTSALRAALANKPHLWVDGTISAIGLYCESHAHRHLPIVLDDVDGLYSDKNAVRLLKGLCATEHVRELRWNTSAAMLKQRRVPRSFETTSRVCIIANDWRRLNANVGAIEDRGHFVKFAPTNDEIYRETLKWFWDQEVSDFVWTHLPICQQLTFRDFVTGAELRSAGLDWRAGILSRWDCGGVRRTVAANGEHIGHVYARSLREGKELAKRLLQVRRTRKCQQTRKVG